MSRQEKGTPKKCRAKVTTRDVTSDQEITVVCGRTTRHSSGLCYTCRKRAGA